MDLQFHFSVEWHSSHGKREMTSILQNMDKRQAESSTSRLLNDETAQDTEDLEYRSLGKR